MRFDSQSPAANKSQTTEPKALDAKVDMMDKAERMDRFINEYDGALHDIYHAVTEGICAIFSDVHPQRGRCRLDVGLMMIPLYHYPEECYAFTLISPLPIVPNIELMFGKCHESLTGHVWQPQLNVGDTWYRLTYEAIPRSSLNNYVSDIIKDVLTTVCLYNTRTSTQHKYVLDDVVVTDYNIEDSTITVNSTTDREFVCFHYSLIGNCHVLRLDNAESTDFIKSLMKVVQYIKRNFDTPVKLSFNRHTQPWLVELDGQVLTCDDVKYKVTKDGNLYSFETVENKKDK